MHIDQSHVFLASRAFALFTWILSSIEDNVNKSMLLNYSVTCSNLLDLSIDFLPCILLKLCMADVGNSSFMSQLSDLFMFKA